MQYTDIVFMYIGSFVRELQQNCKAMRIYIWLWQVLIKYLIFNLCISSESYKIKEQI